MIYTLTLNPSLDYLVGTKILQVGGVNRMERADITCGGKGINVSAILTQLEIPNTALGFIAGLTGQMFADMLQNEGINSDFISLSRGMTRINVKISAREETELNALGPEIPPDAMALLQQKLDLLQPGDILVLSGSIPPTLGIDTYAKIMAHLQNRQLHVVVDTAGEALRLTLPYRPLLIKPNQVELAQLLHITPQTDMQRLAAAYELQKQGAQNVLLSLAGDGALLLTQTGKAYRIGSHAGQVLSSVGAGDAMVAGFLAGLPQGYEAALRLATACGSATAFSVGMAKRRQIDAFTASACAVHTIKRDCCIIRTMHKIK